MICEFVLINLKILIIKIVQPYQTKWETKVFMYKYKNNRLPFIIIKWWSNIDLKLLISKCKINKPNYFFFLYRNLSFLIFEYFFIPYFRNIFCFVLLLQIIFSYQININFPFNKKYNHKYFFLFNNRGFFCVKMLSPLLWFDGD